MGEPSLAPRHLHTPITRTPQHHAMMVVMNEVIWCVAYGLGWWWVALMTHERAQRGASSGEPG
jgi:hypothetical protein